MSVYRALFGPDPTKRTFVQQKLDAAFEGIAKAYPLVPAATAASPRVAIAVLEEIESLLVSAAAELRVAHTALREDPQGALTPRPVPQGGGA